ncbi:hypothetical protein ABFS83_07G050900 [Erythranthe nasuta]
MAKSHYFLLIFIYGFLLSHSSGDWDILNQKKSKHDLLITLKNYCESWRVNVELHNIRNYETVPEECVDYIGKYMSSTQYKIDSQTAIEECTLYLGTSCGLKKDGKDAWIFDIDDTLLSTLPYYKKNGYGGKKVNSSSVEEWMKQGKGTVLEHSLGLFNKLKEEGVQIVLVSSRRECIRSATVDNLVSVGYHGWTSLILRGADDESKDIQKYKADVRKKLISNGYRIWGILGDQWSSIDGLPAPKRTFKLPNPMYYVA